MYDTLKVLSTEEWNFWWRALLDYHFTGNEPEINDTITKSYWSSLMFQYKIANEDKRRLTSAENGKHGGRPRKETNQSGVNLIEEDNYDVEKVMQ